jgi:NADH-quinone oxidoreductase subunit C
MEHTSISLNEKLIASFDDIQVLRSDAQRLMVVCKKDTVIAILNFLKNEGYDHLALVSCVDRIKDHVLELVYIVTAYTEDQEKARMNILVKSKIARDKPIMQTLLNLFENAEPYERELHELFGIVFTGHPRLTPLFLEREYEIPPFRKDFDTRKYVKDVFDAVPTIDDLKGEK